VELPGDPLGVAVLPVPDGHPHVGDPVGVVLRAPRLGQAEQVVQRAQRLAPLLVALAALGDDAAVPGHHPPAPLARVVLVDLDLVLHAPPQNVRSWVCGMPTGWAAACRIAWYSIRPASVGVSFGVPGSAPPWWWIRCARYSARVFASSGPFGSGSILTVPANTATTVSTARPADSSTRLTGSSWRFTAQRPRFCGSVMSSAMS